MDKVPHEKWTHLCMTADHLENRNISSLTLKGYIDGELKSTGKIIPKNFTKTNTGGYFYFFQWGSVTIMFTDGL